MSLQLSHNSPEINKDFSAINGITSLRLSLLSSMQLRPTSKSKNQPGKVSNRMFANDNAPVHIETNGPFEFDFKSNLARFSQQVTVKKMDQFSDQVSCAELLLKFKPAKQKSFIELDAASDNEYELQSIVAKGNDRTPAILNARSQNAHIKANMLRYDLSTQIVQATDADQVTLQRGDTHFVSKSITYQLTDDKTLGQLSAIGPGQIIKHDAENPFRATWAKQLNIKRRNKQQHLIQLQGKSHLHLAGDTHMNANRINLIVWEVPVPDQNGNFARWSYQPAELTANKRVHVSSDKLIADADQLHANWPKNPKAIQLQKNPVNIFGKLRTRPDAQGQLAGSQTVRRVSYNQIQAASNDPPLIARGQRIEIVVLDDANQKSKISDLQMIGDVIVNKPSTENQGQNELTVTGDTLHMVPIAGDSGEDYRVEVRGTSKLAQILTDQFRVDGQEIFLDQIGNSMWIKGQGQVIIDDPSRTTTTDSLSVSEMNIRFAGGMIFDGQSIYFEQSVMADVKQHQNDGTSHTVASGNALKITLDQKIQFAGDSDARKSKPQIVQMIFQNAPTPGQSQFQLANFQRQQPPPDVLIQNTRTDKSGQVVEKLHLVSRRAEMNRTNDQLIASGPGSVEVYRKSDGQSGSSGLGFVGKGNNSGNNSITYIHIHFDNQLQTGLNSRDMAINGNIRSIYVPVENFEQRFDPTNPVRTPPGTVRLFCNRMEMSQSKNPLSPNPKSQFTATGNAQISADQFASRGDRISYRQDTENITIESLDGRNITLRTRANAQSRFEGQEIVGSRLIYNLQTKSASVQNVESLSASFNK
jgi:lipopolysaccharide export system protein LptA